MFEVLPVRPEERKQALNKFLDLMFLLFIFVLFNFCEVAVVCQVGGLLAYEIIKLCSTLMPYSSLMNPNKRGTVQLWRANAITTMNVIRFYFPGLERNKR